MIWPGLLFNLGMGILFASFLLRAVRRFERRADALLAALDAAEAEELRKYDDARDEIRASLREQVDEAIAHMRAEPRNHPTGRVHEVHVTDTIGFSQTANGRPEAIPTEEEMAKLPRWARVAFAARCVRRVVDLLPELWPLISGDDVQSVEKSVGHAEEVARSAQPDLGLSNIFKLGVVDAAHHVAAKAKWQSEAAAAIALAAAGATYAAYTDSAHTDVLTRHVFETVTHTQFASAGLAPPTPVTDLIRREFDHLMKLAEEQHWTDDTPVPPSVFGPLWPEGPPKDWPRLEKAVTELTFEFDVPDDMTTAGAIEFATQLAALLCELDLAGGGHGLAIRPPLELTAPVRTGSRV